MPLPHVLPVRVLATACASLFGAGLLAAGVLLAGEAAPARASMMPTTCVYLTVPFTPENVTVCTPD